MRLLVIFGHPSLESYGAGHSTKQPVARFVRQVMNFGHMIYTAEVLTLS